MSVEIIERNQTVVIEEGETSQIVEIVEETVEILEIGVQGPPGTNGLDSDKTFQFVLNGQTDVTITHNLNKIPSVTVIDSANDEVEGDYQYIDPNNVRLLFSSGFSGKAIFN